MKEVKNGLDLSPEAVSTVDTNGTNGKTDGDVQDHCEDEYAHTGCYRVTSPLLRVSYVRPSVRSF